MVRPRSCAKHCMRPCPSSTSRNVVLTNTLHCPSTPGVSGRGEGRLEEHVPFTLSLSLCSGATVVSEPLRRASFRGVAGIVEGQDMGERRLHKGSRRSHCLTTLMSWARRAARSIHGQAGIPHAYHACFNLCGPTMDS